MQIIHYYDLNTLYIFSIRGYLLSRMAETTIATGTITKRKKK